MTQAVLLSGYPSCGQSFSGIEDALREEADRQGTRSGCLKQSAADAASGSTRLKSCEVHKNKYLDMMSELAYNDHADAMSEFCRMMRVRDA